MSALLVADLGQGPGIVLLHGVGAGPDTFAPLAELLAVDHRVLVLERPGGAHRPVSLEGQAEAVAEAMAAHGAGDALVVGVSGGATLALALAIRHREVGVVVHEPLVGRRATALHQRFAAAARQAERSDAAALEVVRAVLGEATWQRLAPAARARIEADAARARAEIPVFAAFDPSPADLASLGTRPLLTTVGARSGPERRAAAAVLAEAAGATVAEVDGAGNAVHLDAPDAFASLVRAWRRSRVGCGA